MSATRFVSSRLVRFFEKGFGSKLFCKTKQIDDFAKDKVTGPVFKKVELRKKVAMPVRNGIASAFAKSSVFNRLKSVQTAILNSSLRTIGIFLFTFGFYAVSGFALKRFVDIAGTAAVTDDLVVAALCMLAGLMFTVFGDKSVIAVVGGGKIVGSLLSNVLGVNDSSLDKIPKQRKKTAVGMGFLFGMITGLLTFKVPPLSILLAIGAAIIILTVMNIPEFGLLLSVSLFSFVPAKWIGFLSFFTLISYLIKCLRLKRNFRFGTADAAMLLVWIAAFIFGCISDGGLQNGEICLLSFVAMYFPAKNMITTEKMLLRGFDALCKGVFVGMAVYLIGEFAFRIPHGQVRAIAEGISAFRLNSDMLAVAVASVLPFAFASFAGNACRRPKLLFILMSVVCVVACDSFAFYVLFAISLLIYIASAFKAPCGALIGGAIILPPLVMTASRFAISAEVLPLVKSGFANSLGISSDLSASTFWGGIYTVCGIAAFVIFAFALVLVLQRVLSALVAVKFSRAVRICGTVAASAIILSVQMFMFNYFYDTRVLLMVFFVLGLCGSVYKIYSNPQIADEEE